jgi:hypothetical protein
MPGSCKWSLSLRFPHQNPVHTSPLPNTCYIPHTSYSSRFDYMNSTGWGVKADIERLIIACIYHEN